MALVPFLNVGRDPFGVLTIPLDPLRVLSSQRAGQRRGARSEMSPRTPRALGLMDLMAWKASPTHLTSFHIFLSKILLQISAFSLRVTLCAPGSVYEKSQ